MTVVFCGIMPHPPIALPEVGGVESDVIMATRKAMSELGQRIKASGAETLVMISPHATVFGDAIAINASPQTRGNFAAFGAAQVALRYQYDQEMGSEIGWQAQDLGLPVAEVDPKLAAKLGIHLELDHGFLVPLYYLEKAGVHLPLVPCSMGVFAPDKLYRFGVAVKRAAEANETKVAVIASGDLSHRLTPDAPAGYDEKGIVFDQAMVSLIKAMDVAGLLSLEEDLCERAGECGLRPIAMMLGALEGLAVNSEVLSYEGPFGVGYMIASLTPLGPDSAREMLETLQQNQKKKLEKMRSQEGYLVRVARQSLESYLKGQWQDPAGYEIPKEFAGAAGVFVSFKKGGNLRGCIGTTAPTRPSMIQEVAYNAVSAGTQDPRFYPVRLDELDELNVSIDVLMPPEAIDDLAQLDVKKYGVIVRKGTRSGLLLPDLEGVDTPQQQVDIAKQKAGIGPAEEVELERFEVIRYK
ncbi:AmmeMemoRadiSam system protein A [Desulfotomaculum sp. 1211_IL3151]|uniref:AmmeMemoRadiSam system protein A n=1 Tax=Desulfotomaculum sp. 1211_IL3151 TaxID=3084055 RepID=UPI002FDAAD39